jgi:hypothetical protein
MWQEMKKDILRSRNSPQIMGELDPPDKEIVQTLGLEEDGLLGILISNTRGLCLDQGTIRFLGASSSPKTPAIKKLREEGFYGNTEDHGILFAYDICGGLYTFLPSRHPLHPSGMPGSLSFYHPGTKSWQFMKTGFGSFFYWCLNGDVPGYKPYLRFSGWEKAAEELNAGQTIDPISGGILPLGERFI